MSRLVDGAVAAGRMGNVPEGSLPGPDRLCSTDVQNTGVPDDGRDAGMGPSVERGERGGALGRQGQNQDVRAGMAGTAGATNLASARRMRKGAALMAAVAAPAAWAAVAQAATQAERTSWTKGSLPRRSGLERAACPSAERSRAPRSTGARWRLWSAGSTVSPATGKPRRVAKPAGFCSARHPNGVGTTVDRVQTALDERMRSHGLPGRPDVQDGAVPKDGAEVGKGPMRKGRKGEAHDGCGVRNAAYAWGGV
jgi:hypothetical protein